MDAPSGEGALNRCWLKSLPCWGEGGGDRFSKSRAAIGSLLRCGKRPQHLPSQARRAGQRLQGSARGEPEVLWEQPPHIVSREPLAFPTYCKCTVSVLK